MLFQSSVAGGGLAVTRRSLPLQEALHLTHVTFLPGAVYPDTVTLVECLAHGRGGSADAHGDGANTLEARTDGHCDTADANQHLHASSAELCCGTHVFNTSHLLDFVITSVVSLVMSNIFRTLTENGSL